VTEQVEATDGFDEPPPSGPSQLLELHGQADQGGELRRGDRVLLTRPSTLGTVQRGDARISEAEAFGQAKAFRQRRTFGEARDVERRRDRVVDGSYPEPRVVLVVTLKWLAFSWLAYFSCSAASACFKMASVTGG